MGAPRASMVLLPVFFASFVVAALPRFPLFVQAGTPALRRAVLVKSTAGGGGQRRMQGALPVAGARGLGLRCSGQPASTSAKAPPPESTVGKFMQGEVRGRGGVKGAMVIASWNVNSVNARLNALLQYLERKSPDVLVLQEIKCITNAFPLEAVNAAGYYCVVFGQKSNNGVAILSRLKPEVTGSGLTGDSEDPLEPQSRYLEVKVGGVRVCNLYLPNGNPTGTLKFEYKLRWMARLRDRAEALLRSEVPFVMLGDYNVCPKDEDCYNIEEMRDDAVVHPDSRASYRALCNLGLTDALAAKAGGGGRGGAGFTFWGYKGYAWENDKGLRIDHVLLSPQAADLLQDAGVDREVRGGDRPSDHAPVWVSLRHDPALAAVGEESEGDEGAY